MRALAFLLASGCVTSGSFSEQAAVAFCVAVEDCAPGLFVSDFGDVEGCHEAVTTYFDCYAAHCDTYDPDDGALCIERWEDPTCGAEDVDVSDCVSVWTDCDNASVGACVQAALGPF